MKIINYLKKKWKIESNLQFAIIFIVFGITGSSSVFIRRIILEYLGWNHLNGFIKFLLVFPIFQVLLLVVGTAFGQFRFFWEFEKKMFRRLKFKKETTDHPSQ